MLTIIGWILKVNCILLCISLHSHYKDAALYVREGETDAKIFHHPSGYWSKKAFKILHHPVYYVTHLIVSLLLMFMAPIETEVFHEWNTTALVVSYILKTHVHTHTHTHTHNNLFDQIITVIFSFSLFSLIKLSYSYNHQQNFCCWPSLPWT